MKSTIIKTLKDDVFDTDEYKSDLVQKIAHASPNKVPTYYGSLTKFSTILFWAIALSFVSSIFQITLGFIDHVVVRGACLVIALASWVLLAYAVFLVRANWSLAISFQEKDKKIELDKAVKKFKEETKIE